MKRVADSWGEEVAPWEARGQSLWKSSDDEDNSSDWNSYEEYDYPFETDEGDRFQHTNSF